MKAILLLTLWLFTSSYSEPARVDPMDILFSGLYPEWFRYSEQQKQDRRKIYELSGNKYLWFPDIHPVPSTILRVNQRK